MTGFKRGHILKMERETFNLKFVGMTGIDDKKSDNFTFVSPAIILFGILKLFLYHQFVRI